MSRTRRISPRQRKARRQAILCTIIAIPCVTALMAVAFILGAGAAAAGLN